MKKRLIIYSIPGKLEDFVKKLEEENFTVVGYRSVEGGGQAIVNENNSKRLVGKLRKYEYDYQLHVLASREESKRLIDIADNYGL